MKQTVLFDIDGTLADIEHRRRFVEADPPDWGSFFKHMGDDTPNEAIVKLYHTLWDSDEYEILILSGRPEKYRAITEQWFIWNEIPFTRILMRGLNDMRSDVIVKKEMLDALLTEGHKIAFVVDDRNSVVDMWRENGITCLQCDYGDF